MRVVTSPVFLFAVASLIPFGLLFCAVAAGGAWVWAPLLYMTLFAAALDQIVPWVAPHTDGDEFPAGDGLLAMLALAHLVMLPVVVWAVAGPSALGGWDRAVVALGAGLVFGQISNPAAHEMIHSPRRGLFRLGMAIYTSLLFGHHTSAHRLVHHSRAASVEDPNTARAGESYYRFARRAWIGSFRAGRVAEDRLRAKTGAPHPYWIYFGGAGLALGLGFVIAGWPGMAVWALLAGHAQAQLLLADYVQHYGLLRAVLSDGRREPVGDSHSWNAPHWFSARLMLNAPRHSDHHAHPSRPFTALRLPAATDAPMLPYPLPLCCTMALVPPLWRRVIHPHLARWQPSQAG